jgi:HD-GYP domain-containing protein (c-di-GMP phosphodiesterase class II)
METTGGSALKNIEHEILQELSAFSVSDDHPALAAGRIIECIIPRVGADSGALYTIPEAAGEILLVYPQGNQTGSIGPDHLLMSEEGKCVIKGSVSYILNVGENGESVVYVPVNRGNKVIGIIEIARDRGRGNLGPDDVSFLTGIAPLLSVLVENIRLLRTRDQGLRDLRELGEISGILNSSLDLRIVREKAIVVVTRLISCEAASLLLIDEATGELYFEVALGNKGDQVKEIRLNRGEGIAGWVAEHNTPIIINDVKSDPRHAPRFDEKSKFVTRNMICVPMSVRGKVIGVLQAINKLYGGVFTTGDMDLFLSLSHSIAIAMDNARLYDEMRMTFYQTAEALADAIEKRDPYTGNHTRRVMHYSAAIGRRLPLTARERENLMLAAILHDVGKIGVGDSVLKKEAELDVEEYKVILRHPEIGIEILGHINQLKDVIPGIKFHHERWDGEGYPDRLKDEEIPYIARIIAVADAFDAMTTDRPYRKAKTKKEAAEELRKHAGIQFDIDIVNVFIQVLNSGE